MSSSLPDEKKLTAIFNLEAGCLGPEGKEHIAKFCVMAQNELTNIQHEFINLRITPRIDISQPEIQYQVNNKNINQEQANKYLQLLKIDIDTFEEKINADLVPMIDQYLGYK